VIARSSFHSWRIHDKSLTTGDAILAHRRIAAGGHDIAAAIERGDASDPARSLLTERVLMSAPKFSCSVANDEPASVSKDIAGRAVSSACTPSAGDDASLWT
jgi:hypothetical protein